MFTNPFPSAFGLDLGDLSVKVVQLRNVSRRHRRQSFDPVVCRSTKLPHGLIVNGIIQEPEKIRKYILHLLREPQTGEKPVASQWVVASLPDVQGFLKRIDIEKTEADVIEEDILYAAKRHIPFGEDAYYVDWQIIPDAEQKDKTSVLIAAVPKKIADLYTYLLESVGLGVIALEIETLAIARAMITAQKEYQNEARAVIDLGASRSSVTIYDHDQIQVSLSIPFSGEMITTSIAQKCKLTYEAAEHQKIHTGLAYDKSSEKCWGAVTEMTDELTHQIQKAIDFYYSHFSGTNKITHITMCGGGATMKRLDAVLSEKLKIQAQPGNVWKNLMSTKKPPIDTLSALGYATAIGLALRAAGNPFFRHDAI